MEVSSCQRHGSVSGSTDSQLIARATQTSESLASSSLMSIIETLLRVDDGGDLDCGVNLGTIGNFNKDVGGLCVCGFKTGISGDFLEGLSGATDDLFVGDFVILLLPMWLKTDLLYEFWAAINADNDDRGFRSLVVDILDFFRARIAARFAIRFDFIRTPLITRAFKACFCSSRRFWVSLELEADGRLRAPEELFV